MSKNTFFFTTTLLTALISPMAIAGLPPAKLLPKYQPSSNQTSSASRHAENSAQTNQLKSDIQALQSQNAQLQGQIRSLNRQLNEIAQIPSQLSEQRQHTGAMQDKIARLQSENHSLRTHTQKLSDQVNNLQVMATKSSAPETQQVMRKQQGQIQILEEHNKVLQKQLNELEARFTQIQTRSKQIPRSAAYSEKDYDGRLQKLQTQNGQLNSHFQALTIRLNEIDKREPALTPKTVAFNQTQEQVLTQLNTQIESLQSQVRRLNGQIEMMNHKIRTLESHAGDTVATQNYAPSNTPKVHTSAPEPSLTKEILSQGISPATINNDNSLPSGDALEAYNQAMTLLNKREFDLAQRALQAFVAQHPTNSLVVNAQYWLAETYYIRRNYQQAALGFSDAYKKYQQHKQKGKKGQSAVKAPEILLKLALSLKEMGNKADARITLDQLESEFPHAAQNIKRQVHATRLELRSRG